MSDGLSPRRTHRHLFCHVYRQHSLTAPVQVLNSAKRELRFLLVYLHDDTSQQSDEFCRGTLCHQSVVDFLNTRLLFWACDTSSSEGHRGESVELWRIYWSKRISQGAFPLLTPNHTFGPVTPAAVRGTEVSRLSYGGFTGANLFHREHSPCLPPITLLGL